MFINCNVVMLLPHDGSSLLDDGLFYLFYFILVFGRMPCFLIAVGTPF